MKKRFPSVVAGILYIPFGVLLAWVSDMGMIGTSVSTYIAFVVGFFVAYISKTIFYSVTRKKAIPEQEIEKALLTSTLYIIPFIILAFMARILLGWSTMMPFIATATISFVGSATAEVSKSGMKSVFGSLMPSILASLLTMVWTLGVSILF